jgi:hypothetical protein
MLCSNVSYFIVGNIKCWHFLNENENVIVNEISRYIMSLRCWVMIQTETWFHCRRYSLTWNWFLSVPKKTEMIRKNSKEISYFFASYFKCCTDNCAITTRIILQFQFGKCLCQRMKIFRINRKCWRFTLLSFKA